VLRSRSCSCTFVVKLCALAFVWYSRELCHACNGAYSLAAESSIHELDLERTFSSLGHNIVTLKNVKRRYSPGS